MSGQATLFGKVALEPGRFQSRAALDLLRASLFPVTGRLAWAQDSPWPVGDLQRSTEERIIRDGVRRATPQAQLEGLIGLIQETPSAAALASSPGRLMDHLAFLFGIGSRVVILDRYFRFKGEGRGSVQPFILDLVEHLERQIPGRRTLRLDFHVWFEPTPKVASFEASPHWSGFQSLKAAMASVPRRHGYRFRLYHHSERSLFHSRICLLPAPVFMGFGMTNSAPSVVGEPQAPGELYFCSREILMQYRELATPLADPADGFLIPAPGAGHSPNEEEARA